jgi:hypothetical protein
MKAEPRPTKDVNRDSGTATANGRWFRRLVRHLHLIIARLFYSQCENKSTVSQNSLSDDGLIVVLAPCFKSGGFDIYTNRNIPGKLNALLPFFGLCEPILVSFRPVRIGQEVGYLYKIVSRIKWYDYVRKI